MANRNQVICIQNSVTVIMNRTQVICIESSLIVPIEMRQVVTVHTSSAEPPVIEIAESMTSDVEFQGDVIHIAESISSIISFPQIFDITGDVKIVENICSVTSEPKLIILIGNVSITENTTSIVTTDLTIISDINESISLNLFKTVNIGVKFQTCYEVLINDVDYSRNIIGTLNVSKVDNAVVSFDIDVMSERDLMDFIYQEIKISLVASDENGKLEDIKPIVIGQITGVNRDVKSGIYSLSCFDYGGIHNMVSEFVSKEVTPMIQAEILIDSEGSADTGHKPILSVRVRTDDPEDPIEDGTDYFVNPLAGTITIPETSRLVGNATIFDYEYPDNFDTLEDLMDNIAAEKGWTLDKSDVTIEEYTESSKHPIITLSDESIIDMIRKFSELSAAKIDTSLFPSMRMYSELNNFFKAPSKSFSYEDDIIDGTLQLGINVDSYINKQTVTSANKVFPNAELGDSEVLLVESGIVPFETIDTINYGGIGRPSFTDAHAEASDLYVTLEPKVVATVTIDDPSITNSSVTPSGQWFRIEPTIFTGFPAIVPDGLIGVPGLTEFRDIVTGDWTKQINEGSVTFSLISQPVLIDTGGWFTVGYEGATWTATINGQPVSYNQGTLASNVEVTACRPAAGKGDIFGDTYENAYIETTEQAGNIANSILLSKGNVYNTSFSIPLHKVGNLRVGDKIDILYRNKREHSGIIKEINYDVNFDSGSAVVVIITRGIK